jgi:beta-glucuronidase
MEDLLFRATAAGKKYSLFCKKYYRQSNNLKQMKRKISIVYLFLLPLMSFFPAFICAQGRVSTSLNGEWTFALDPVRSGEQDKWYQSDFPSGKFDKVIVPHCFSVDKRYELYTGKAWYFRRFSSTTAQPGTHQFLHFDAVFYKARVWLNGELTGMHEGGYTPFELDVTGKLREENVLAVEADNSWDTTTIPGAKTAVPYQAANSAQLYPWINYGGITRSVSLISRPDLFVQKIKVITNPDLKTGQARVQIIAMLTNLSASPVSTELKARIYREGKVIKHSFKVMHVSLASGGGESSVLFETSLSPGEVDLWDQDHPNLYHAEISMGQDTLTTSFGIRKLQLQGNRLLLNGEPIKMGGANRPLDHPEFGSIDPAQVLEKDLGLMKSGCMEMSRINHYPLTEAQLNWADSHGLLFIEEAGNWQMTPKQMSDPLMRRKFESQMREMVERDWNHPCIFAWSVGNEFQSQTQEGKDWVKDMRFFTRNLDSSRFITFASMMLGHDQIKTASDEASQYVDFISANMYGNYLKILQHIHALYPDKAVFVSEFGIRTDGVKDESDRIAHLRNAMTAFRSCDYVIGACVWTFQDYRSRFPGSNVNGYRPWGLVTPQREPRGMYIAWQEEFAPAILEKTADSDQQVSGQPGGTGRPSRSVTLKITARKDFPAYTLRDYTIRCNGRSLPLHTLHPGESQELTIGLSSAQQEGQTEVSLVKPGGFVILKKVF